VQWVVQGAVEVNTGANPSAEGGDEEGVDDQAVKVVDIVDTFRLQVWQTLYLLYNLYDCHLLDDVNNTGLFISVGTTYF